MLLSVYYSLLVFGHRDGVDDAEVTVVAAFESLPTWRTKCTLLRDAAEHRSGTKTAKKLTTLLSTFDSIQKRRNNVVHGRWFMGKNDPTKWIRRRGMSGKAEEWDTACFVQLRDDTEDAITRLGEFFSKVRKELKGGAYLAALAQLFSGSDEEGKDAAQG
jgi:hypothetical protein